ncbi:WGR domain-containing protein [Boseaceae bacterium BT-24-1]|nr:WGR domain-containing protein [Boseaceae bacterium BT-24-1]
MEAGHQPCCQPTLFGDTAVVREWGRLGSRGRRRLDLFPSIAIAQTGLSRLVSSKERRGYRLRSAV